MRKIGLMIERERAWGRLLCEGVAAYAQGCGTWALEMLEREDLVRTARLRTFDGFLARVADATTARRFARIGRPVADLSCERRLDGIFARSVEQDNEAIGRLAARHFLEHRFVNFAFCGYTGKRFSDERRDAFVRCLEQEGFACHTYRTPRAAVRDFDDSVARHERLGEGPDAAELRTWLDALPKPVAVFCANDLRSFQLLCACKARGLAIPHDVAILGVDNDALICNFTAPTLSSIDPDAFNLGHSAAECLDRFLDGERAPRPRTISPKELIARASTEIYPLDPPWLSDALVFIQRNLGRHLSASDVYRSVGLSHTRVNAAFHRKLHTTVQGEIRRLQVAEAKHLLRTTALPLAEVARRTGFATPQYFCNVFTALAGQSPSAYCRTATKR